MHQVRGFLVQFTAPVLSVLVIKLNWDPLNWNLFSKSVAVTSSISATKLV